MAKGGWRREDGEGRMVEGKGKEFQHKDLPCLHHRTYAPATFFIGAFMIEIKLQLGP